MRFAATGGLAGAVQLLLLHAGTALGGNPLPTNVLAFLVATQVNFCLSQLFTWRDRRDDRPARASLMRRWLRFHAAISGTAMLNMVVFAVGRTVMPDLLAAALGIGAAGLVNFVLADRFVFRSARAATA
ncbi:MAG TPA: GtrA family protein [Chloroflexota bacterium]|nr:GtrA family protein [Chloroflexota bacterium]